MSYPDRGLMVDCGRKYFTPGWLHERIDELGSLGLNLVHLHLSDDQGFRIESETHPEVVTEPFLTKAEIRELLEHAARRDVTVVPEIDLPAHVRALLAHRPDLQLPGQPDKLDVANPGAYPFAEELLAEYLPLFSGPWWHLGADEYLGPSIAHLAEPLRDFLGRLAALVRDHGKRPRIWNDALAAAPLDSDVVVECWDAGPSAAFAGGHEVVNCNRDTLYYVLGWEERPDPQPPHVFYGETIAERDPRNRGAKLHVWCDRPELETEEEIAAGIREPLRALAAYTALSAG